MPPTLLQETAIQGDAPAVLDAIVRAETALAIWDRILPGDLRTGLASLDLDTIDDLGIALETGSSVETALRGAGYPDRLAISLAADIADLTGRHAALTGEDRLTLRLEVVETDACRRFHADYVTLRLICTYIGPGTQWHRVEAAGTIAAVPTGAVAIFKGKTLLDPPTVLHRSPPIAATGDRRLMIVIDPARPVDH